MNKYKVIAENGVQIEGIEETQVKDSVIALDPEAEQTKVLVENGALELVPEESEVKEKEEDAAPAAAPAPVAPKFMYMDKLIINETLRTVNDKTYKHVTLEDHTTHDLTDEEYAANVTEVQ